MLDTMDNSYHFQKYMQLDMQHDDEKENYINKIVKNDLAKFLSPSKIDAIRESHNATPVKPTIVLMGEIKAGKSSLINALLGQEIVKAKSTVATAKNTYLDYGSEFAIYAHYYSGVKRKIPVDQLEKYTVEEASTLATRSKVDYIQIYVPHPLLKVVRLVDSPGLNSQNEHHTEETEKLFKEATVIYWIFNHGMVGRKSEIETLDKLKKLNNNIIGIINMIDLHYELSDEPIDVYLQDSGKKLSRYVKELIGVSATYALDATEEEDDDLWEDSNLNEFINSILSFKFDSQQITNALLKPIMKQISEAYKEALEMNNLQMQLVIKWEETARISQDKVDQYTKSLHSINEKAKNKSYNTLIDLAFLKEINRQLYDSLTDYVDAQSESLRQLYLFIQNNTTFKDDKINATKTVLKVKWDEYNELQIKKAFKKIEEEANTAINQMIHELNNLYEEWQALQEKNNRYKLRNFILNYAQILEDMFDVKLPNESKLEYNHTTIHRVEKEDYSLPAIFIPAFKEMELDFTTLMSELYEKAYDYFVMKVQKLNIDANIEEMKFTDKQLVKLEDEYIEKKGYIRESYIKYIREIKSLSLLDLLKEYKSTLPPNLKKAFLLLSTKVNRVYTIQEIVEIWEGINQDLRYWKEIKEIRTVIEQELPQTIFNKWNELERSLDQLAFSDWSHLYNKRMSLNDWRNDVLQVIGTPQIREVAKKIFKQTILNKELLNFDEFTFLDEWDHSTPKYIQPNSSQLTGIFGKKFYNDYIFLSELLLHHEQYLQKLLNNFKKEFENNVNQYEKNKLAYQDKFHQYRQFAQNLKESTLFSQLQTPLINYGGDAYINYNEIIDSILSYETEVRYKETNVRQLIERGKKLYNTYNQLPRIFMSKEVRKNKKTLIIEISYINNNALKGTYRKADELHTQYKNKINHLYGQLHQDLNKRIQEMNKELHDDALRINNYANNQYKLNNQLTKWNELINHLNDELEIKKLPIFRGIEGQYLEEVSLRQVSYQMGQLQPSLRKVPQEFCPEPVLPKFYIPMPLYPPFYLFIAILLIISAVVFKYRHLFP